MDFLVVSLVKAFLVVVRVALAVGLLGAVVALVALVARLLGAVAPVVGVAAMVFFVSY